MSSNSSNERYIDFEIVTKPKFKTLKLKVKIKQIIKGLKIKPIITCFIFTLVFCNMYAQKHEYSLIVNTRNSKVENSFDYYSKLKYSLKLDTSNNLKLMCNFERDAEIYYYSYMLEFNSKYSKTEYFKDTEKDIEYFSNSLLLPYKCFRFGLNAQFTDTIKYSVNLLMSYKRLAIDLLFLNKLNKLKIEYSPKLKLKNSLAVGFDINYLYFENKNKWNSGLSLNYVF